MHMNNAVMIIVCMSVTNIINGHLLFNDDVMCDVTLPPTD